MTSRAQWAAGALDLTRTPEKLKDYLTIGQVCDLTNLAEESILDDLTRSEITNAQSSRGVLCRPAAKFGDVPFWSPEQVEEYHKRKRANENRAPLPRIELDEARARQLVSTEEQARRFDVHDQTVRRWQARDGDYPVTVGRRDRGGRPGVPDHVRPWPEIVEWAAVKGRAIPYPDFDDELNDRVFSTFTVVGVADVEARGLTTTKRLAEEHGVGVAELAGLRQGHDGFPEPVGRANLGEGWRLVYPGDQARAWIAAALELPVPA